MASCGQAHYHHFSVSLIIHRISVERQLCRKDSYLDQCSHHPSLTFISHVSVAYYSPPDSSLQNQVGSTCNTEVVLDIFLMEGAMSLWFLLAKDKGGLPFLALSRFPDCF